MHLRKYHGLGNDFLIVLDGDREGNSNSDRDGDGRQPIGAALARAVCDRRRGVGADGLIHVTPGPTMTLFNADGSRAETSGNGLRCLARAVVDAGIEPGPEFTVTTDAGPRRVRLHADGLISVDMGAARVDGQHVDLGNPHLVEFVDDLDAVNGGKEGINVEYVVAGPAPGELSMRVFERGLGETQACGSGACAAAAVAHAAGLVGPRVTVHQPGGDAIVELMPDGVVLTGPAEFVCEVEFPWP